MPINDSRVLTRNTKSAVVHKVIDITQDAATPSKQHTVAKLLATADRYQSALFSLAAVLFAVAIVLLALPHGTGSPQPSPPRRKSPLGRRSRPWWT